MWLLFFMEKSHIYRKIVGDNIRYFRLKKEFSQEKLAVRSELTSEYISRVERAVQNISVDSLVRIANALKTEPYLFLVPRKERTAGK